MSSEAQQRAAEMARARRDALGIKGGRPKRSKNKGTLLRENVLAHIEQRIFGLADKLLDAHIVTAIGTHRMVVVTIDDEGKKHIETVREESRMQELLDTGIYGLDYLIVEGTPADWRAIEALENRAFGKPKETIDQNVTHTFSLRDLSKRAKEIEQPKRVPHTVVESTVPAQEPQETK